MRTVMVVLGVLASLVVARPAAAADGGDPGPVRALGADDVTADALPTAQLNGVAWAQAVVGDTVYVGGSFTKARPAGSAAGHNEVTRANLLAYDITTGDLLPFAVPTNGAVLAVAASPDHTHLYLGGMFTTVAGKTHNRIAAIGLSTGQVDPAFTANASSTVRALATSDSAVYAGGSFNAMNGSSRGRLAKLTPGGALFSTWKTAADSTVRALVVTPDGSKLVVGGSQTHLGSTLVRGIGAVDAATGAVVTWKTSDKAYDYGSAAGVWSLTTDGSTIHGTGFDYHGTGNFEGMFDADASDGHLIWLEDCHGDSYDSYAMNGLVYLVGHPHYCGNDGGWLSDKIYYQRAMAFTSEATGTLTADMSPGHKGANHTGVAAPSIVNWFPALTSGTYTGIGQAAWTIEGNGTYLALGGEFPKVNGVGQQGLVRYVLRPAAPRKMGPRITRASWKPKVSRSGTTATITVGANYDWNDTSLTYQLLRDGLPVDLPQTVTSTFWLTPTVTFSDALSLPSTRYSVRVTDPDGNIVTSTTIT